MLDNFVRPFHSRSILQQQGTNKQERNCYITFSLTPVCTFHLCSLKFSFNFSLVVIVLQLYDTPRCSPSQCWRADAHCGWSGGEAGRCAGANRKEINFYLLPFPCSGLFIMQHKEAKEESRCMYASPLMSIKYLLPIAPCINNTIP